MINNELVSANMKSDLGFLFSRPVKLKPEKLAFNQNTLIPQSAINSKARYSKRNLNDLQGKSIKEDKISLAPKESGKISLVEPKNI